MSHVKSGGKISDKGNVVGKRLGVKRFGGQPVNTGEVLVRQTGSTKIAGPGTFMSKNFTIHAAQNGVVAFQKVKKSRFTGKTAPRTQVIVK
jgi:large subunit ribosomal protein L27